MSDIQSSYNTLAGEYAAHFSHEFDYKSREEMLAYLKTAGFQVYMTVERFPYADFEYPTRRVYIQARKPL